MVNGKKIAGMAVAATAAALFMAGCASTGGPSQASRAACMGVNGCKGMSDCKGANSSCKGQNSCKGQGFVTLTQEECKKLAGTYGRT